MPQSKIKETLHKDVVIIGSGPAGLTAAIYSARANLSPLVIDAPADAEKQTAPGGQLMITTEVENYPGFAEGIQGPDLMVEFRKQAERFGTDFLEAWITEVELQERPFTLHTFDHIIKYTGSGNDRDPILVTVGSTTPNNTVSNIYSTRDVNLNAEVKYTGSGNDRDPILVNVGSTTPNNIRVQQLP